MEVKNKYAKYFESPNLKAAGKRAGEEVRILRTLEIPENIKHYGIHKSYLIRTFGCQMNEHDTEVMKGILETMGFVETEDETKADIILLNTCAIRENAEDRVFGVIGSYKNLKRERPELILGVCGCMSQEESVIERILQKHNFIDMIFGTHNIHRLPQLIESALFSKEMVIEVWSKEGDVVENLPKVRDHKFKAWVNIMYGCDKFCTYCIVPFTRGKERSRLPEDILDEVKSLKEQGYKEITLLGQNVNAYGKDLEQGYEMGHLLEDVAKLEIPRIRFTTSHPWDFDDYMIEVIQKYPAILPHIHLPVQSGSSRILRYMGRSYTRENYIELFDKLRLALPKGSFTTDIIVGFPNETDEQFEETMTLYEYCQFDSAFTFLYSPREGTPAARMKDNIDQEVKKERLLRLNERVRYYANEANKKLEGETMRVLVESVSKTSAEHLTGYSQTNKLVHFKGNQELIGKIVDVRITEPRMWSLNGEFLSVVE